MPSFHLTCLLPLLLVGCATAPPPASVRVAFDRDGTRGAQAAGLADQATRRRVTADDPVRIASISKLVTAIAVMRMVEAGTLDLDADISARLGYRVRNPAFPDTPISLRLLLSHRSSLRDDAGYALPLGTRLADTLADPRAWDAAHAPGPWFHYTNLNFPVIASVMERASGERFDRLMRRLVLAPLRLDACFNWSTCSQGAVARAVVLYDAKGVPVRDDLHGRRPECDVVPAADGGCDLGAWRSGENGALFSPQGGLRISMRDLATIGRLIARGGEVDGVRLLSPASIALLAHPKWTFDGANGDTDDGFQCRYGLAMQTLSSRTPGCADDPFGDGAAADRACRRRLWPAIGAVDRSGNRTRRRLFRHDGPRWSKRGALCFLPGGGGPGRRLSSRRPTTAAMKLLYDGPHIQVLERPGSSDYVLVTFGEMGMRADGRTIWGRSLIAKLDLNAVGFVAKDANWYPAGDLARASAAAAPALARFRERIGYGFSQGGYAAIKASLALSLTQTIAVSPQTSIDPADVADERFSRFYRPELHTNMRIVAADAPQSLHLFYDRAHRDDREQADLILAALPAAHAHPMPFTDHDTIRAFADSTAFPALIDGIVSGRPEAVASRLRRDSPARKAIMVQRAIHRGRIDRAITLLDAVRFTGARRQLLLADFADGGAATRVLPLVEADLRDRPGDPLRHAVLALALATVGRAEEAERHIEAALTDHPHGRVQAVVDRAKRHLATKPQVRAAQASGWRGRVTRWSRRLVSSPSDAR